MMKTYQPLVVLVASLATLSLTAAASASRSGRLIGVTGVSVPHGSGWLQIPPTDFAAKERLVLTIGGSASAVMVRLLPKGFDPNGPDVTIAEKSLVRTDRTVEVALTDDFKNIVQVSVHGLSSPFGRFDLGIKNGPATLIKVERVRP